ncbi:hypothetical protein RAS1_28260 [Phycisphaerae bacterium RAS1]|nr:hypothetical protein RAS1_28260 [Phycisphaerae bacterium RAS1]
MFELGREHPLRRLLAGLVENTFTAEVGICDPAVTEYVSGLLVDFVHVDRIFRLRTVDGEAIRDLSRMEAEAHLVGGADQSRRARLVNRYIGDFTLFWTGVYPEALRPRCSGADRLREYLLQGKRSYTIASELTPQGEHPPAELLRALSDEFEFCVHGLQLVRGELERLRAESRSN